MSRSSRHEVRIRISWPGAIGMAAGGWAPPLVAAAIGGSPGWVYGCFVAAAVVLTVWYRQQGIDLTPTKAVVRRAWRRDRRVAWADVEDVTIARWFGGRVLALRAPDGELVKLTAPASTFGFGEPGLRRAHDQVSRWWAEHRDRVVATHAAR